jgi:hypothetical protein
VCEAWHCRVDLTRLALSRALCVSHCPSPHCCRHFIYFVLEFNLMDQQEMQPLDKLINKLKEAKEKK